MSFGIIIAIICDNLAEVRNDLCGMCRQMTLVAFHTQESEREQFYTDLKFMLTY